MTWFLLGLLVGVIVCVFALEVATRRCTCYPDDEDELDSHGL
jgi:hypothetical protein